MDLFSPPQPSAPQALSVTQLLRRMKNVLEAEVGELWVEGEVSNLKKQLLTEGRTRFEGIATHNESNQPFYRF